MAFKFFTDNIINDDGIFSFTSANQNLNTYLFDNNYETRLTSSGSDDLTDEVFEIEFNGSKTIDRIFIGNHNIKAGEVEYFNGAIFVSFSAPVFLSGNTADFNYFEFDSVSTTKIRFTMNTSQIVDDEKQVGQLRAIEEIGEVNENPSDVDWRLKKRKKQHTRSTGGTVLSVFGEKYRASLIFDGANLADIDLFETLNDLKDPFMFFPGGGDINILDHGFRIQDMFLVNYVNDFAPKLKSNLFNVRNKINIVLHEV